MCCGTKSDPSIEKKGLVLGHAYTLVFNILFRSMLLISLIVCWKLEILGDKDNGMEELLKQINNFGIKWMLMIEIS